MIKMVHGGDIYSAKERIEGEIIDFSANINPLGLPQSVKEALGNAMDAFSHYPDPICRELVKELAESERCARSTSCAATARQTLFSGLCGRCVPARR